MQLIDGLSPQQIRVSESPQMNDNSMAGIRLSIVDVASATLTDARVNLPSKTCGICLLGEGISSVPIIICRKYTRTGLEIPLIYEN